VAHTRKCRPFNIALRSVKVEDAYNLGRSLILQRKVMKTKKEKCKKTVKIEAIWRSFFLIILSTIK